MNLFDFQPTELGAASAMISSPSANVTLKNCKIRLYQADLPIDKNMTLSVLNSNSATFTGYGDQTITWANPSISADGVVEAIGTTPAYRPTDGVTPNNIYGCYLVNQNGDLMLAGRFDDAPIPMVNAFSQLTVSIAYRPTSASIGYDVA